MQGRDLTIDPRVIVAVVLVGIGLWIIVQINKAIRSFTRQIKPIGTAILVTVVVALIAAALGGTNLAAPTQAGTNPPTQEVQSTCPSTSLSAWQQSLLQSEKVNPKDWGCVDFIFTHESGWCATKRETIDVGKPCQDHGTPISDSVGYGLCQSTPAWKMRDAGADWATNPQTQLRWCIGHAKGYGGWKNSYTFWVNHHWW